MSQTQENLGKKCTDDQDYNPFTKRCNKKCSENEERVSDPAKRTFKCYKKCAPGSVRSAKTNRCNKLTKKSYRKRGTKESTKKHDTKEIEKVLMDLDSENEHDEQDTQDLVYEFAQILKNDWDFLTPAEKVKIKRIIDGYSGIHFDDDVKNELEDIYEQRFGIPTKSKSHSSRSRSSRSRSAKSRSSRSSKSLEYFYDGKPIDGSNQMRKSPSSKSPSSRSTKSLEYFYDDNPINGSNQMRN